MSSKRREDPLGHLVPLGSLHPPAIKRALSDAMASRRYTAGIGVPSAPTRYVVTMNPADRAWLEPGLEDELARDVERSAEDAGLLVLGPVEVEFSVDARLPAGRPRVWCGFAGEDLLVLAGPEAALEVFARA